MANPPHKGTTFGASWDTNATRDFYLARWHLLKPHLANTASPARCLPDDAPGEPYQETDQIISVAAHIGQLKLLLSEVDALTRWSAADSSLKYVVYAGSAPGHKLGFLSEIFPHITFILVDPTPHNIRFGEQSHYHSDHIDKFLYFAYASDPANEHRAINLCRAGQFQFTPKKESQSLLRMESITDTILSTTYRFYVIEDYFTIDLAETLSALPNLRFISDIRTKSESADFPSSFHILWNSCLHLEWLQVLDCPAMTKFRCPFTITNADKKALLEEYNAATDEQRQVFARSTVDYVGLFMQGHFIHLDGEIRLQAFAPTASTETRLHSTGVQLAEYNYARYEQAMFYVNRIDLLSCYPSNLRDSQLANELGVCLCRNCALCLAILQDYIDWQNTIVPTEVTAIQLLASALSSMRRTLKVAGHGKYTKRCTLPSELFAMLDRAAAIRHQRALSRSMQDMSRTSTVYSASTLSFDDTLDSLLE